MATFYDDCPESATAVKKLKSKNDVSEQRNLCITRTVKHNYNSSISTVRIQLHVSVLYVGHLQVEIFNLQISYKR